MTSQMRALRRELRSAVGQPIAYQIRDGFGASIAGMLESVIRGERVPDADIAALFDSDPGAEAAVEAAQPRLVPGKSGRATAVVPVRGVATYGVDFQPLAFSTIGLAQVIERLAADAEVGQIVLDMDTPGGHVTGTREAADAVWAARQVKEVTAICNPLVASAGYWIASQASRILAVPSADVGSIGVMMMHADCSLAMESSGVRPTFIFAGEHKVEGNPYEPLSESARQHFQTEVDAIYRDFVAAVARGRSTTASAVIEGFGGGRTLRAGPARRAGMVDRVLTLTEAYAMTGLVARTRGRGERAEALAADCADATEDEAVLEGARPDDADEPVPTLSRVAQIDRIRHGI